MRKAFGELIKSLRHFIGQFEESYTQADVLNAIAARGEGMAPNTYSGAENSENKHDRVFELIAAEFSERVKQIWLAHRDSAHFDPLKWYRLAFLFDRLRNDIEQPILSEDLIMNRVDRYFVNYYGVNLTVIPCSAGIKKIERADCESEQFRYDNLARVTYELEFADDNRRKDPGFKLEYVTKGGRIELIEPKNPNQLDDRNYLIHRTGASYRPIPDSKDKHRFEVLVFGGYNPDQETAHFSMKQPAIYDNVSFSLDLSQYPIDALIQKPELIIVPLLKNSDRDCCQIARDGDGLKVKARKVEGLTWNWRFEQLADVMICVRWKTDQEKVRQLNTTSHDSVIWLMSR